MKFMINKYISVIIPVYNEEKYIEKCLDSVVDQTYPKDLFEIIIVDGGSTDRTKKLVEKYEDMLDIKVLYNEKRLVTYALNIGIENSLGEIIIRLDAHAEYDKFYIEKCVYYLENMDIQNVGGVAETIGIGWIGEINAEILSSKFGVGNSSFRTDGKSGFVDTVPFGAFNKEIFNSIGLFNPNLSRSEDNDINSRIRKIGGKIYLSNEIKFRYFCRDTVYGLLNQAIQNGNALFLTFRENPRAMSFRHFVPFLFVISLLHSSSICLPFLSIS